MSLRKSRRKSNRYRIMEGTERFSMKLNRTRSKQDMSNRTLFLFIVVVLFFTVWLIVTTDTRNNANIQDWTQRHGYVAYNVQQCYWSPFWFWRRKGDAIYKADLVRNGSARVSYFRCSIWGVAQRWEDGTTDDE